MILDQKQKQFWNHHAKRNNNPRDPNASVLLGAFLYTVQGGEGAAQWQGSNLVILPLQAIGENTPKSAFDLSSTEKYKLKFNRNCEKQHFKKYFQSKR